MGPGPDHRYHTCYLQHLGGAVESASVAWIVFCPCIVCSETRRGWRADSVQSSRRVVLSSERLVADWRRSTCAACAVVSRSTPSVSESSSDQNPWKSTTLPIDMTPKQ